MYTIYINGGKSEWDIIHAVDTTQVLREVAGLLRDGYTEITIERHGS